MIRNNRITGILLSLSILSISSCGLKYIPTETPQAFEDRRHTVVETYIQKELSTKELIYESVAFGPSEIVKPISYNSLDSLYAIKYKNEKAGKTDLNLDEKIENQRMIALNDTNKVIYIEDHVFSLGDSAQVEFYSALFQLDHNLNITDMVIKESTFLPKRYGELYKEYLFEESFLFQGYLPNSEEIQFYNLFKNTTISLSKAERDDFVLHTLTIMELARKKGGIKYLEIAKAIVSKKYIGTKYSDFKEIFSELKELKESTESPSTITGYSLVYSFTDISLESKPVNRYKVTFDQYLRIISEEKLP